MKKAKANYDAVVDIAGLFDVVYEICDSLDIEAPAICVDEDGPFATETTMAAVQHFGEITILYLNPNYSIYFQEVNPLNVFIIAHELRHIYQRCSGEDFRNYVPSSKTSLNNYNRQYCEMDANAFGLWCVNEMYESAAFNKISEIVFARISASVKRATLELMNSF